MKRILVFVLALFICSSLFVACAPETVESAESTESVDSSVDSVDSVDSADSTDSAESVEMTGPPVRSTSGYQGEPIESTPLGAEGITVGYVGLGAHDTAWIQFAGSIALACDFHGATLVEYESLNQQDSAEQIGHMEDAIADGVDVIILAPADSFGCAAVIKKAYDAGIPVVILNIGAESEYITSFITNDDVYGAIEAANYIASKTGEKGKVVYIHGDDSNKPGVDRRSGFEEGIAQYPDMEIVVSATTNWDALAAQNAMVAALDAYDDIVGVYCAWDGATLACNQAIVDAGRADEIILCGTDSYNDALIHIFEDDSAIAFDVYKDFIFQGYLTCETAIKAAMGMEVESYIDSGSLMLTTENIHDWCDEYSVDLYQKREDDIALAEKYAQ